MNWLYDVWSYFIVVYHRVWNDHGEKALHGRFSAELLAAVFVDALLLAFTQCHAP